MIRLSKSILGPQEQEAVRQVMQDGYLGMGPETGKFEQEIKSYLGGKIDVVCVNTGTSALHLACQAIELKQGDEVLVPSLTYVASYQAISACGATPVSCDVDENTGLLDLSDAEKRITQNTKAIMPVHYTSEMGDLDALYKLANNHGLRVIEDAAHAFGCRYNDQLIGSIGDIVCFSFDGIKNITSGEGGAVISKDQEIIKKVKDARLLGVIRDSDQRYQKGRSWDFEVVDQGWRYHMSDLMAAIGRVQLKRFENEFKPKRKEIAAFYRQELKDISGIRLLQKSKQDITPHIFVIRVLNGKREMLRQQLLQNDIQVGIHYKPNHLLKKYGDGKIKLNVTEKLYSEILTLPLHPHVEKNDVLKITQIIKQTLNKPKVVIAGVSSFIGYHLARFLSDQNYHVIGTVLSNPASYKGMKQQRFNQLGDAIEIKQLDLTNEKSLEDFIAETKPDYWIYQAGYTVHHGSLDYDQKKGSHIHVAPLAALYKSLSQHKAKGIVMTGSSMEYSNSDKANLETDDCNPTTPYGQVKLEQTQMAYKMHEKYQLPTRIARIYVPYGLMDTPTRFLPFVIQNLISQKEFDLSVCTQKRDFLSVDSIVTAYQKLLTHLSEGGFEIFNICSGKDRALKEIVEKTASSLKLNTDLVNFGKIPLRKNEPPVSFGSNQKAKEKLNWEPQSLDEGLQKYLRLIKEHQS